MDLGTAITFDCISAKGEYVGGVIMPGIGIAAEALFQRTAKLPRVEIREPDRVIGTNTINSIRQACSMVRWTPSTACWTGLARCWENR